VTGACAANDKVFFSIDKANDPANLAADGLLPLQQQMAEPAAIAVAGDQRMILSKYSDKYPNIAVRFSSYRSAKDPTSGASVPNNIVGDSWVVSKAIPVDNVQNLCVTLSEAIFDGKAPLDLNDLQIVYSTDFAGDVAKASWTALAIDGRSVTSGNVKSNASVPTQAYGVPLAGVQAGQTLYIGLHYKGTAASAPWWGIETLKVTAKNP
jgi:hypothetical protein